MRRRQISLQPHPVGDPLDKTRGTRVKPVVLQAVHQLVHQHPRDLGLQPRRGDARDVVEGEVDLLCCVGGLGADGVGDAGHGAQDQGDGFGGGDVDGGVGGGVEVGEDSGDVRGEVGGDGGGGEEGGGAG
ncbi:hypothetical protein V498_09953, partial [Pseudogymnoascus sp. VKM F-4517 (FW-2822)]